MFLFAGLVEKFNVHSCNKVWACIVISTSIKISHAGHLHSTIFGAFINAGVLHGRSMIMNDLRLGNEGTL